MYKKLTLFSLILAIAVIGFTSRLLQQLTVHFSLPLDDGNGFGHYYLAAAQIFVIVLLGLLSWTQRYCRSVAMFISLILALLVAGQGALGILSFRHPYILSIQVGHKLLAMLIVWILFWLYLRVCSEISLKTKLATGLVNFARLAMVLLCVQLVFGVFISVNHVGLACAGFPQCNGAWWPITDYQNIVTGFISGSHLELTADAAIAMHLLHRLGAVATFIVLTVLILAATSAKQTKSVRRAGLVLSLLLFAEIGFGIAGSLLAIPLWVEIGHTVFATLLMLPLLAISFYSRYSHVDGYVAPEAELAPKFEPKSTEQKVPIGVSTEEVYVEPEPESVFARLQSQLRRTRSGLSEVFSNISLGQKEINDDLLEEIEASLLMADIGVDATTKIINRLTQSLERHQLNDSVALSLALKQELLNILKPCSQPLVIPKQDKPFVILVVGVNGAGKTTTIGKLAKRLQAQGHSVMLAAGDTFRAAAVEQLQTWGERNNIHVVAQHTGADSASVIYDGVQSAQAKGIDVLIADTAGRLHTKSNLMDELKKVKRIMSKQDETAPHEVLLVLDAGTGQNALSQAKLFNETVELTGLVLTKLDGTAKGGVIFALAKQSGIPIRYIGVGEGIDDLQDFNAETFVEALFAKE